MKKNSEIKSNANELFKGYLEMTEKLAAVKTKESEAILGNFEEAYEAASSLSNAFDDVIKCIRTEGGVSVSDYYSKISMVEVEGKLDHAELYIRTRIGSPISYKETTVIKADENFLRNLGSAFANAAIQIYYLTEAKAILDEINGDLSKICEENEIGYTVQFALGKEGTYVTEISDSSITFNADVAAVLNASTLPLFDGEGELGQLVQKEHYDKLISNLKANPTPVQLIKARIDLVTELTGVKLRKRVDKILRYTYHKQAIYFNSMNKGFGYYKGDAVIDGAETTVFALLEKTEDGEIKVVLSPFDINTLYSVDYDVLSEVKASL